MAKNKKFSSFLENPIDYTLIITVLLLLTVGLIMVLSASSPTSLSESAVGELAESTIIKPNESNNSTVISNV